MKEKINIYGTNLSLVKTSGVFKLPKKEMRCQLLISDNLSTVVDAHGKDTLRLSENFWYLEKNSEKWKDKISYSHSDYKRIIFYALEMIKRSRLPLAEDLIRSLGDIRATEAFYSLYGTSLLTRLKILRNEVVDNRKPGYTTVLPWFKSPRYSVYALCKDLVGSEILLMDYKRITGIKSTDNSNHGEWKLVEQVSGNSLKPNINLQTVEDVNLDIPDNKYGIKSGTYKRRSAFCIVENSILHTSALVVRTKNTKLVQKLKRIGCITPYIYSDEFIVDLEKLPLVRRRDIGYKRYSGKDLLLNFTKMKEAKLNMDRLSPKVEKNPFGIYGDQYIPPIKKKEEHFIPSGGPSFKITLWDSDIRFLENQGGNYNFWKDEYKKQRDNYHRMIWSLCLGKVMPKIESNILYKNHSIGVKWVL